MITVVRIAFALSVTVLGFGITASHAKQTASIRVLSSNAFRAVMLELTPQFESTTGTKSLFGSWAPISNRRLKLANSST